MESMLDTLSIPTEEYIDTPVNTEDLSLAIDTMCAIESLNENFNALTTLRQEMQEYYNLLELIDRANSSISKYNLSKGLLKTIDPTDAFTVLGIPKLEDIDEGNIHLVQERLAETLMKFARGSFSANADFFAKSSIRFKSIMTDIKVLTGNHKKLIDKAHNEIRDRESNSGRWTRFSSRRHKEFTFKIYSKDLLLKYAKAAVDVQPSISELAAIESTDIVPKLTEKNKERLLPVSYSSAVVLKWVLEGKMGVDVSTEDISHLLAITNYYIDISEKKAVIRKLSKDKRTKVEAITLKTANVDTLNDAKRELEAAQDAVESLDKTSASLKNMVQFTAECSRRIQEYKQAGSNTEAKELGKHIKSADTICEIVQSLVKYHTDAVNSVVANAVKTTNSFLSCYAMLAKGREEERMY